jgi:hypothetical protein
MHRITRMLVASGVLGAVTLGFGCGIGPVRAIQNGGSDGSTFPYTTVERSKDCMAEYGLQLEPGYHALKSTIEVNDAGYKEGVSIEDVPDTAYDFGACMRNVFRDMPIAEEPLRRGVESLKAQRAQARAAQRSLMSSPVVVVVGVTIVVSELVLEAGAYTILFAVTIKVVDKAKDDVNEALKRNRTWKDECTHHFEKCMDTVVGDKDGNHWQQSRCGICHRVCITEEGSWPTEVGNGSCEYWKPGWK